MSVAGAKIAVVTRTLFDDEPAPGHGGRLTIAPERLAALADVPHPFPYQGSKRALAHAILRLMPEGVETLVEPFAGSAAISIATRHAGLTDRTVIGDVNAPLMELWCAILEDPEGLSDRYEEFWHEGLSDLKVFFFAKRDEFNKSGDPAILLYLLNRIVKGAVRYSKAGAFNQSADNRRAGAKPALVRERLTRTSRAMVGTRVVKGSYEPLLVAAQPSDVVYMDPPYQGVTDVADRRYASGLARVEFERVLAQANDNGVSFIVSYDAIRQDNRYGEPLASHLELTHLHVVAGRSAQATLSGRDDVTVESLYISPALATRLAKSRARGAA